MNKINDLKPDHKNARKRTDRSASLIQESLERYGAARSIVIDEDGRVLAGNGTVEVGLALADNRTSDLSDWDASMLHHLSMEHEIDPWFEPEDLTELMDDRTDAEAPEDFKDVDEDIETEHRCPSCGYEWSGKAK